MVDNGKDFAWTLISTITIVIVAMVAQYSGYKADRTIDIDTMQKTIAACESMDGKIVVSHKVQYTITCKNGSQQIFKKTK